jgi:4-diphosphocytidyl-2-C-methyl-D-erythritol kinase
VTAAVEIDAHAKINLFLRVEGRRPDGYHELDSLILPLSLADRVELRPAERMSVTATMDGREAEFAENLALLAALAMAEAAGGGNAAEIRIDKHIPVAGGLGGGSADAAAVLHGLNRLWECDFPEEVLIEIGATIGSDVPALVTRRAVRIGGRGERVAPVPVGVFHWVLVPANFEVRTPEVFGWWDETDRRRPGDPERVLAAAVAGEPVALADAMFNDLEPVVVERYPRLAETRRRLGDAGALGTILCGSGGTFAGLARDASHAAELAAATGGIACSGPPA